MLIIMDYQTYFFQQGPTTPGEEEQCNNIILQWYGYGTFVAFLTYCGFCRFPNFYELVFIIRDEKEFPGNSL